MIDERYRARRGGSGGEETTSFEQSALAEREDAAAKRKWKAGVTTETFKMDVKPKPKPKPKKKRIQVNGYSPSDPFVDHEM